MSKSATEYLRHILHEIAFIETESQSILEDQFMRDEVLQHAFSRSLEIIGEASKNISEEYKKEHTDIDWKALAGLRDKLIHHYFGVDYQIVWDVIKNELPTIENKLKILLSN